MPSEAGPENLALVFPGQGAHCPEMLAPFADEPGFPALYEGLCDLVGFDVNRVVEQNPGRLNENRTSSLVTVVASLLALRRLKREGLAEPRVVAGYSVGQWTALHAAGLIDETTLLRIVAARAQFMDEALRHDTPGGMLAVIGVPREKVDALCRLARDAGDEITLSNDNAPAQLTLAGTRDALGRMEHRLRAEGARRVVALPVAGAWHSPSLAPAVAPLEALLSELPLAPLQIPVVDNISGAPLPAQPDPRHLAEQVARPVLWRQSVRHMVSMGLDRCLEVGYGDVLTKFGFFIDRSVRHEATNPPPRIRAPRRLRA